MLNQDQKNILLKIAKESVESFIKTGDPVNFKIDAKPLMQREGAFVTLKKNGELRGCIGQIIQNERPLWKVVRDMAIAAAVEDLRFPQVNKDELEELEYEISVLSVPKKIDNWQDIKLGKHGVIVKKGFNSGVFLPQVATETGWSLEEFLSELCSQKAGLERDAYKNDEDLELLVFTADVF